MKTCLCHSKKLFAACCEPLLSGKKTAVTPVELMQSRFSAYSTGLETYLLSTWHPTTRPPSVDMAGAPVWLNLEIVRFSTHNDQGMVEFKATYRDGQTIGVLHETSRFSREEGIWFYVDGVLHKPLKILSP